MTDTPTLGLYLRLERERRGLALRSISESTKLSVSLLDGLESDDISRWPGGIFRRAFVRSYAQCVGLDPDEIVRRFEAQFPPDETMAAAAANQATAGPLGATATLRQFAPPAVAAARFSQRTRIQGTAADLGVALVLAFGFAAAGSRMLWPVLLIACYYAVGVLLTGTSPMVALLSEPGLSSSSASPTPPDEPDTRSSRKSRRDRTPRRDTGRRSADRGVATTQDAQARI